jgi:DNA polymerase III epsilon subunit-like protein
VTERALAERKLWENTRLVVVDVETTGLQRSSRILSFAAYVVENGATVESWSTLINPGIHIGAKEIHGLDPTKLANAKSFPVYASRIRKLLTSSTKTTFLTGHRVSYDAGRLRYEYQLLGEEPPPMLLLDNKRLAPAAGVGSHSSSLADLAGAFGLTNPAPHEANAEALTTREVSLRAIDLLIGAGVSDLTPFAVLSSEATRSVREEEFDLSVEHLGLHAQAVTSQADREKALDQCLEWSCPELNRRIEDGLTDAASARSLFAWSLARIETPGLSRFQRGMLVNGALRTMTGHRDALANPKPAKMLHNALAILGVYHQWTRCDTIDQCDRCAAGQVAHCRFVKAPSNAVWSAMYSSHDQVPLAVARKYLCGAAKKPIGAGSWYEQIRALNPDAALRGAVVAARTLRSLGYGDEALVAVKALWRHRLRTPGLTEVYAALEEDNLGSVTQLVSLRGALRVCDVGLKAGTDKPGWERVTARRARLVRRMAVVEKPPFVKPYNQRPPHALRFARS